MRAPNAHVSLPTLACGCHSKRMMASVCERREQMVWSGPRSARVSHTLMLPSCAPARVSSIGFKNTEAVSENTSIRQLPQIQALDVYEIHISTPTFLRGYRLMKDSGCIRMAGAYLLQGCALPRKDNLRDASLRGPRWMAVTIGCVSVLVAYQLPFGACG
eukprot:1157303-Pelagomonas_calceolata.AAC.8